MKHTFSIKKAINFGWETFWKNPWFWVISWTLVFGLSFAGSKNSFGNEGSYRNDYMYPDTNMMEDFSENLVGFQNTFNVLDSNVLGTTTDEMTSKTSAPIGLMVAGFIFGVPFALAVLAYGVLVLLIGQVMKMGWIHLTLNAARDKTLDYKTLLSDVNLKKVLRLLALNVLYGLLVAVGLIFFIIPGIYFLITYAFSSYFLIDKDASIGDSFKMSAELTKGNKWKLLGFSIVSMFVMFLGFLVFMVGAVPASIIVAIASAYIYTTLGGKLSKKES